MALSSTIVTLSETNVDLSLSSFAMVSNSDSDNEDTSSNGIAGTRSPSIMPENEGTVELLVKPKRPLSGEWFCFVIERYLGVCVSA